MRSSALWLLGLVACSPSDSGEGEARTSVLVVYADDLRHDVASIVGNPYIETPNLDRIAGEGALFERSYVVSSRCCPGRASFMTGLYPTRHGVWSNHPEEPFPGEDETLADLFQEAGYRTAWIGKWHLPNPGAKPVRGFDHFVSYEGPGSHFNQIFTVDGKEVVSTGFQADRLTDYALEFLSEGDEPFFCVLAFKNPHVPMTPAPRHAGMLDDVEIPPPASASDPDSSLPSFYAGMRRDSRHQIDDIEETSRRYWELCLSLDDNVGRVLDHLGDRLASTAVVVTGDNGQLLGEHGLSQKGLSYEPSIRVPLMIRGPKIPAGLRTKGIALNTDLMPTLCELAGIDAPSNDGESLLALCRGESWRHNFAYLAPGFGNGAVVERALVEPHWKYVRIQFGETVEECLFDLAADPDERVNQISSEADRAERMRDELTAARKELGDL